MKILINGEYEEVGFWSWMKCHILVSLALTGLIWGGLFLIAILSSILFPLLP